MIQTETKHHKIIQDILKKYPYTFYAYGSRTKGKSRRTSDLDLCFVEPIPFNIQSHIEEDFEESDLPFRVDISDYNLMDEEFRSLIDKDLTLLHASENFLSIEQNLFAKFRYLPEQLGYAVKISAKYTIINCGLETSTFNIVCATNLPENNIDAQIDNIIAEFKQQPFAWWLGPSSKPAELRTHLQAAGLVSKTREYAMRLELNHFISEADKTNLRVMTVTSQQEILDFASIVASADPKASLFYTKIPISKTIQDNNYALFVGYVGNEPIAIGSLFFTQGLAGIFDLITLEKYRNQSYGTAILQTMLRHAKEKNYQFASLPASSVAGINLYKKLGFQTLGWFECFEWRGQ